MERDELLKLIEQAAREEWTELDLSNKGLTELPSEIGHLTALENLNLGHDWGRPGMHNQFINLPPEIGQLIALRSLNLYSAGLTILPSEIDQLIALQKLDLSENNWTAFPSGLWKLATLEYLNLRNSGLTVLPPEIGQLTGLQKLDLSGNDWMALLPEPWKSTLPQTMDFKRNNLTALPPEIGQLSILQELNLSGNKLTSLPPEIGQLSILQELNLSGNELASLPPEIGQLTNLRILNLGSNQFPVFPLEILELLNLQKLLLYANRLTRLPSELGQLTNLRSLILGNNKLTDLPSALSQLRQLHTLQLSGNQLSRLSSDIVQLTELRDFSLNDNQLATIPSEIRWLSQLQSLDFSGNQLTVVPPEIGQLSQLQSLNLSKNRLTSLPLEIGKLSSLRTIYLDGNPLLITHEFLTETGADAQGFIRYLNYIHRCFEELNLSKKPELLKRLYSTLVCCGPFEDRRALEAIFVDSRITLWRKNLPESNTPSQQVQATINYLYAQYNIDGENALVSFLRVLSDRQTSSVPKCPCQDTLNELVIDIEKALADGSLAEIISITAPLTILSTPTQKTAREPLAFPQNLLNCLRETLRDCEELHSEDGLARIFNDIRISAWHDHIRPTSNRLDRVDEVIYALSGQYNDEGQNVLVLFIRTLSDRPGIDIPLKYSLANRITEIEIALTDDSLTIVNLLSPHTKAVLPLPPNLLHELRDILLKCHCMEENAALEREFLDLRISAWRDCIHPTNSRASRVNEVIYALRGQYNDEKENILVLFLNILAERTNPGDARYGELTHIATDLKYCLESFEVPVLLQQALNESPLRLNLSARHLQDLPPEVLHLEKLESLDLSNNCLTSLPPEIVRLHHLRNLNLHGNALSSLPPELLHLTNLEVLDIRNNPLASHTNFLEALSTSSGNGLSSKTYAHLQRILSRIGTFSSDRAFRAIFVDARINNWHSHIPDAYSIPERAQATIDTLQNQFDMYGDNALVLLLWVLLDLLEPSDALQTELRKLLDIVKQELNTELYLPFPSAPTILNYYFGLQREHRPLNEVKLLLVGESSVGKTSLVKQLMYQDYDPQEPMTEGVLVEHFYRSLDGEPLRLNIWDFGGQEIMHATHQFFLSRRSLYLVVIDARTGERGLDYWLQIVRSYGGDSPISVVINKDDICHIELNEVALRAKYPNICAFIPTTCADKTHPGIAHLRQAILDQVAQMPHIRTMWPDSWFRLKASLEQMEDNYISYDEYKKLCITAGIANTDIHTLTVFLHDLGVILNYDDIYLRDINVLKPGWVTQAVYSIINARQIAENAGILEVARLGDILRDQENYPENKQGHILRLMENFQLIFALDERSTRYVVPDLLPKNEILLDGWPLLAENSLFQYRYSVLPGSVITRLIVKMYTYIHAGIVWRTGVCLRYQDNFALIKADETAAECLTIAIIGNPRTRREFLALIRERIQEIHDSFKGITIAEYVALPGYPDLYEDYKYLLGLEQRGKRYFSPHGLTQDMPLATVLDSVIAPEDRGAISGISEDLLTSLQKALAATGFCDDVLALRHQLNDSPVALWIGDLREVFDDPQAQAYEVIRNFHNRTTTAGQNGLDLFLQWLIPKVTNELQRTKLSTLSRQLVTERTAYYTTSSTSGTTNVIYNITVKEGGQVGVVGNGTVISGDANLTSKGGTRGTNTSN